MVNIQNRQLANGTVVYDLRVYTNRISELGGKRLERKQTGFTSHAEALKLGRSLDRQLQEEIVKIAKKGFSWEEIVSMFGVALQNNQTSCRVVQENTKWDTMATLKTYTACWKHRIANEISPGDVRELMAEMECAGKSKSRRKAVRSAINSVYGWAIENRKVLGIFESPAKGVTFSKLELSASKKQPILTLKEIRSLLHAAREIQSPWFPVWAVALLTGCRSGELIALKWKHIDFDSKMILVQESYNGRMKGFKSTKGGYWREVPMNEQLENLLKDLYSKRNENCPFVLPRIKPWIRGEGAKAIRAFCVGIGITEINFHATRACFATQLLRAKVPAPTVMKICGWTEYKTMMRYIRLAGIEVEGATQNLDFIRPQDAIANVVSLF